jgi:hypothetical protein
MASVKEFIEARKSIETLADKITLFVEQKAKKDLRLHLNKANKQLEVLKAMVANDVQVLVASRLSRQLTGLGTKVEGMIPKTSVKKVVKKKQREAF